MADYDYKAGKKRIEDILDNVLEVKEKTKIPKDSEFTYNNGYYGWVTSIFVDIRDSSTLFGDEDKEKVSKVIRSFTSEIIEILRKDDNLREIGIRGDCVYGIYATPKKLDIVEVVDMAFYINTYMNMLDKLLSKKGLPSIQVGIGVASAEELVVKAGRKDTGINNKVWIGKAVTGGANLSSLGSKNGLARIVVSSCTYNNVIDELCERNKEKDVKSWFTYHNDTDYGVYYDANVVKSQFDKWINEGMKEE